MKCQAALQRQLAFLVPAANLRLSYLSFIPNLILRELSNLFILTRL